MKVGSKYKLRGQIVTLVKIFPFHPRLPARYRVTYENGACTDCRQNDLEPI